MGKRGKQPIEKPFFWSKEYYLAQKDLGISDIDLINMFGISTQTFWRWKKQLGFKNGDFHKIKGERGRKLIEKPFFWSKEYYLAQKDLGVPDIAIASMLDINISTLYRWKRQLGFKNGDFEHIKLSQLELGRKKRKC